MFILMTYVSSMPQLPIESPPHARCGIASSIMSAVIAIAVVALLVVSPETGNALLAAELGAWTALVAAAGGVILGIIGAFQQDCQKVFSFVGLGLNVAAVFVTGSLMAVGAIAY